MRAMDSPAPPAVRTSRCCQGTDNGTDIGTAGHGKNIMPPLQALLRISRGGIKSMTNMMPQTLNDIASYNNKYCTVNAHFYMS